MKKILIILMLVMIIPIVNAQSFTLKENDMVNMRFRCFDENNNYCSSSTDLLISIEYPNGSNAYDNISMTYNPTYYNITLPTNRSGNS